MRINHNIAALNTYNKLSSATSAQSKSMEKLSSGLRINTAADDAAGLAISEKMRGQIRGLDQATSNAQDGISLIQTAEGALSETTDILQRMRELSVQASNDTATDADRSEIQKEVSQLKEEINRISNTTEFNTKKLLDGSLEKAGLSLGTKLESVQLDGTKTQGTSVALEALQDGVTISTGINDKLKLAVDGGTATEITISQGKYDTAEDLVGAINDAIGNQSALAGKVTAELDNSGKLSFVSASTGTSSSVAVSAPTTAGHDARASLGFSTGAVTANVDYTNVADTTLSASVKTLDLTVDGVAKASVDLTEYGMNIGDTFGENAASVTALQAAFDDQFGKDLVKVELGSGELKITSNRGTVSIAGGTANGVTAGNITAGTTTDVTFTDATVSVGTAVSGASAEDKATSSTRLVALGDGEGNNLGLRSGNQVNISVIVGGEEKTGALAVTGTTTLQDLADQVRDVIGGTASISVDSDGKLQITGQQGEAYGVSNLKLDAQVSSSDSTKVTGNFAEKLSSYKETQAAEDANVDSSLTFHIGANQAQTMKVDINEMSVQSLSLSSVDVSTQSGAETAMTVIQSALDKVSTERSKLGSFQNRLDHTINNLGTSSENLTAAESRIRDVDYALAA